MHSHQIRNLSVFHPTQRTSPQFLQKRYKNDDPRIERKQKHRLFKSQLDAMDFWLKDKPTQPYERINKNKKKPAQKYVIMARDHKIGIKNERVMLKRPLANHLISQGKAMDDTVQNRAKSIALLSPEEILEVKKKRRFKNYKQILERTILYFRRTLSGHDSLIIPVTRWQICSRLWQTTKLVLQPEAILDWKDDLKKPGRYEVAIDVGEPWKLIFRVVVTPGNKVDG
jgi:ribosomal protein L9